MSNKKFTINNLLSHIGEKTSIKPIKVWKEEEYGEEINVFGKVGDEYVFSQYHKDCLDPDWNNIDCMAISEIFLTKKDLKVLKTQMEGL